MGYDVRADGEITITPPLGHMEAEEWKAVLKKWGSRNGWAPLRLELEEETKTVKEGKLTTVVRSTLVPFSNVKFSGSGKEQELITAAMEQWPGHVFAGEIEYVGEDSKFWRVGVKNGVVYRIEPELVWPEPPTC